MGTAVRTAKTSPASWNAFSDVDAFVDAGLAELAAMAANGTRRPRSGPKPTLTRLSREWGSSAEQAMTGRMFQRLGTDDSVLHGWAGWRRGRSVSMLRISLHAA